MLYKTTPPYFIVLTSSMKTLEVKAIWVSQNCDIISSMGQTSVMRARYFQLIPVESNLANNKMTIFRRQTLIMCLHEYLHNIIIAVLYALRGVEIAHEWTGLVTRGWNVKSGDKSSDLITDCTFFHLLRLTNEPSPLCLIFKLNIKIKYYCA